KKSASEPFPAGFRPEAGFPQQWHIRIAVRTWQASPGQRSEVSFEDRRALAAGRDFPLEYRRPRHTYGVKCRNNMVPDSGNRQSWPQSQYAPCPSEFSEEQRQGHLYNQWRQLLQWLDTDPGPLYQRNNSAAKRSRIFLQQGLAGRQRQHR